MHLCSCGTKIEEITSLRTGDVICRRHITTGLRISLHPTPPNKKDARWASFVWRSRRDSNSRAAFGDYTISSRARYDHFDTTPYSLGLCDSIDYYTKDSPLVKKKLTKIGRNFRPRNGRAFARSASRPAIPVLGVVTSCRRRTLPPDPRRYPHAAWPCPQRSFVHRGGRAVPHTPRRRPSVRRPYRKDTNRYDTFFNQLLHWYGHSLPAVFAKIPPTPALSKNVFSIII